MIANIALDDALILPHRANPAGLNFRERQGVPMADRTDELRATAAQCLALAQSTTDPRPRVALTIMAQKLYDMATGRPGDFEAAQKEFNERQMLPRRTIEPQPTVQQPFGERGRGPCLLTIASTAQH